MNDSSPAAFHVGQDFIKLVLSHYERRENHSLGKVGVIADDDSASCTCHERACAIVKAAIVSRTEEDLPFVRTTGQTLWFTRTTAQKKELNYDYYEQELYSKFLHSIVSHDDLNYPLIGNARVAFCSGGKVLMEAPCAYKVEEHYICQLLV